VGTDRFGITFLNDHSIFALYPAGEYESKTACFRPFLFMLRYYLIYIFQVDERAAMAVIFGAIMQLIVARMENQNVISMCYRLT